MVPGQDRTCDPWICSQTRICSQTCDRLRYAARFGSIEISGNLMYVFLPCYKGSPLPGLYISLWMHPHYTILPRVNRGTNVCSVVVCRENMRLSVMSNILDILVIIRWTKSVFKLEREFDGSNPYMKFGRNLIKNE